MAQVSTAEVVNLFKKVYGDLTDLLPSDYPLAKDIPFSEKQKVGEKYIEAVVLSREAGLTLGGSGYDAFTINPAIAGSVKQAEVSPYVSIVSSVIPYMTASRSAGGGVKAFMDATRHLVKNNLKSHGCFQEIFRWYGQAAALLGYVSYATATYRGVAFTNGTGTLTVNGSSVAFTNGVNTTSKWILLAPGNFASGIWVGMEGVVVKQVNSSGTVVASGQLVAVDSEMGAIQVDFTPVAASSTTSHRLCFDGMESSNEMVGVNKVLTTSGTVFGISNTTYAVWRGATVSCGATKFTFDWLQQGVAQAVNRGGLDGDIKVYVNPRTWGKLITTEAGLRKYDSSYKTTEAENGMESITFYTQTGKAEIVAHRMIKEGEVYALHLDDWSRSGSSEISFTVPGLDRELIYPLEQQAGFCMRSYTDQYMFCHAPAKSIAFTNVNDEASS